MCTKTTFLDLPELAVLRIYQHLDSDGGAWSRHAPTLDAVALSQTCRRARATLRLRMHTLAFPRLHQQRGPRIPTSTPSNLSRRNSAESGRREPNRADVDYAAAIVRVAGDKLRDLRCENDLLVRSPMTPVLRELAARPVPPLKRLDFMHRVTNPEALAKLFTSLRPSLRHLGILLDSDELAAAVTNANLALDGLALHVSPGVYRGRSTRSMYIGADESDTGGLTPLGLSNILSTVALGYNSRSKGVASLRIKVTGSEASPRLLEALVATFRARSGDADDPITDLTVELLEGMEDVKSVKWVMQLVLACSANLRSLSLVDYHVPEYEPDYGYGYGLAALAHGFPYGAMPLGTEDDSDEDEDENEETSYGDRIAAGGKMTGQLTQQIVDQCPYLNRVELNNVQYEVQDSAGIIRALGTRLKHLTPVFGLSDDAMSALSRNGTQFEELTLEFQSPRLRYMLYIVDVLRNASETLHTVTLRRCGERRGEWKPDLEPWTRPLCHFISNCGEHEGDHKCHSLIWTLHRLPELLGGCSALRSLHLDVAVHLDDLEQLLRTTGSTLRVLGCENVLRRSSAPPYRDVVDYENSYVSDLTNAWRVVATHCRILEEMRIMGTNISATNCKRGMECCHNACGGECRRRVTECAKNEVGPLLPRVSPDSWSSVVSMWWHGEQNEDA
jgi:hypothetical protein